jgi:hypothetical protein
MLGVHWNSVPAATLIFRVPVPTGTNKKTMAGTANFFLFREIEYQVYLLNSIGRNLDYTR